MKINLMPINRQMDNENELHRNNVISIIIGKNDIVNLQEKYIECTLNKLTQSQKDKTACSC